MKKILIFICFFISSFVFASEILNLNLDSLELEINEYVLDQNRQFPEELKKHLDLAQYLLDQAEQITSAEQCELDFSGHRYEKILSNSYNQLTEHRPAVTIQSDKTIPLGWCTCMYATLNERISWIVEKAYYIEKLLPHYGEKIIITSLGSSDLKHEYLLIKALQHNGYTNIEFHCIDILYDIGLQKTTMERSFNKYCPNVTIKLFESTDTYLKENKKQPSVLMIIDPTNLPNQIKDFSKSFQTLRYELNAPLCFHYGQKSTLGCMVPRVAQYDRVIAW